MMLLWLLLAIATHTHAQITLFSNSGSPSLIFNSSIPYTISSPGRYIIAENITYNASGATPAITINSNNVTVDLIGRTIAQTGGVAGVSAISIATGISNVSVANGVISDFSQSAITVAAGVTELTLDSIAIKDCGNRGIELVGTTVSPIVRPKLLNCSFQTTCTLATADNVLTLSNINDAVVNDCNFFSNGSTVITATLTVIKATNCLRLTADKVDINDTTGAFHVRGINLNGSTDCVHTDCRINTMVAGSGGSIIRGICLENGSTTNLFHNCFVQKLTCTTFVDGFISDTLCDDNVFTSCTAFLNRALDVTGAAHGFRAIANNRNEFRSCTARRNSSFSSANTPLYGAYGFKMDSTNSTYISQCVAISHFATVRSVGFFFIATVNCFVVDNIAGRNTFGFDAANITFNSNAFTKNFASKNTGATQYNGFPTNSVNDAIVANAIATNNAVTPGPIAWTNLGIT